MIEVTNFISTWVRCCRDVWANWFQDTENGEDEFYEVEEALFSALVLANINLSDRPDLQTCYSNLYSVYKNNVSDFRSVCRHQRAGNIFCESVKVSHKKDTVLSIKSISVSGSMLNGEPYVELMVSDQEFILEPLENVKIYIRLA